MRCPKRNRIADGTSIRYATPNCRAIFLNSMRPTTHQYEVRPRKDHRGVDLISDALPFGRLCYGEPNAIQNALGYAQFYSRAESAVIHVYDVAGNLIETHEHADFKWKIPTALTGIYACTIR